jgi:hypothetical protein
MRQIEAAPTGLRSHQTTGDEQTPDWCCDGSARLLLTGDECSSGERAGRAMMVSPQKGVQRRH